MPQLDCNICRCPITVQTAGERVICPYCHSSYIVEQEAKALALKLVKFAGLRSPDDYYGVQEVIANPPEVVAAEKNPVPVSPEEIPPPRERKEIAPEPAVSPEESKKKLEAVIAIEGTEKKTEPAIPAEATHPETAPPTTSTTTAEKGGLAGATETTPPSPSAGKDRRSPKERILAEEEEEFTRQAAFLKQFRSKAGRNKIPAIILLCLAGAMVLSSAIGVVMLFTSGYDEDIFNFCFALPTIILLVSLALGIFFLIRYLVKRPLLRTLQKLLKEQEAKVRDLKEAKES